MKLLIVVLLFFSPWIYPFHAAVLNNHIDHAAPCCVDYCYAKDSQRPQNMRMNTKTAYQLIKDDDNITVPSGCTPSKFWLISRHGTRLPTPNHIPKMQKLTKFQSEILTNYANGNQPSVGALCEEDLELLQGWRWDNNITTDIGDYLTVQGWNDLKGMAEYYKGQYPSLVGEYGADKFLFKHTNTQRTEASYKAFVDGLFGEGSHDRIPAPVVPAKETLLRPYDYCPAWTEQKEALDSPTTELSKFKSSPLYKKVVRDVAIKTGYPAGALSSKDVESMFEMCSFETAWSIGASSPWCSVFNADQIKVFEYAKDISEWYESGSATQLNSQMACELVQDLLEKLTSTEVFPMFSAYFAHVTTVQLLFASLGIARQDIPLRADNYEEMTNRSWITSKISPFATNLAAVRYDCDSGPKIQFLLNQRPLADLCSQGLCDLSTLKAKYATIAAANCSSYFCAQEKDVKVTLNVNE